jgi:hypothetical protein
MDINQMIALPTAINQTVALPMAINQMVALSPMVIFLVYIYMYGHSLS